MEIGTDEHRKGSTPHHPILNFATERDASAGSKHSLSFIHEHLDIDLGNGIARCISSLYCYLTCSQIIGYCLSAECNNQHCLVVSIN